MFDFNVPLDWRECRIPKKRKGEWRKLTIPNDALKDLQRNILYYLYNNKNIKVACFAHGFVPGRSIYSGVNAHSKLSPSYLCMDVKGFFDNFPVEPVRKALREAHVGYGLTEQILKHCTYHDTFPQGAPTSPFLTNIGMYEVDLMIRSFCKKQGYLYTRYADDITLSWLDPEVKPKCTHKMFNVIDMILQQHLGLHLAKDKSHVIHKNSMSKPQVLGIVIRNDGHGYNAPSRKRHNIRAGIHNLVKKLVAQNAVPTEEDFFTFRKLFGYVAFSDQVRSHSEDGYNGADPHYKEDEFNYLCGVFHVRQNQEVVGSL